MFLSGRERVSLEQMGSCSRSLAKYIKKSYNQFHNILRLFDVSPNFSFTTSETMSDYDLYTGHVRAVSQVAERLKT